MKISARQSDILELVKEQGFVATDQLVERFGVTPQTIRRDINILCGKDLLQRFHGGAGQAKSTENEPYSNRLNALSSAKHDIGKAAADHIPNGSSLFLNIGTTTEMVARALLDHKNLRIVTNNLNIATILSQNDSFEIMIAGGQLRGKDGGIVGPATTDFIKQFRLDYGVIGVSGIEEDGSLVDFDYQETRNAQAIIVHSKEVMLVADHSKFGRRAMTSFGHISDIDMIFTDEPPNQHYANMLREHDVNMQICAG